MRGFYRKVKKDNQQAQPLNLTSQRSQPRTDPRTDPRARSNIDSSSSFPEGSQSIPRASRKSPRQGKQQNPSRRGGRWNWQRFLWNFVAFWIIMAAGCLVAFSLWTGLWLMIEPDSIIWLNQYLPSAQQISPVQKNPPQTLEAIKNQLSQKGFQTGEAIVFQPDILLPILKTSPDCSTNCQRITELRLYQPLANSFLTPAAKQLYQLKRQLVVGELEESFVIAPLVSAGVSPPGTSKPQPFSSLTIDPQAPKPGIWLHLTGKRNQILYGQVIHYTPQQSYLSVMAEWTSPTGKIATWQKVADNAPPELIIDSSVGLEPSFRIYRVQPRQFTLDPLWLVELNLNKAAINSPTYQSAMALARQGLWSAALKILQSLKETPQWSAEAQAQLELVKIHAEITSNQAKMGWANPSQAILAQLIDGRWAEALSLLETIDNPTQMQEVVNLLKKDAGQLGERVRVALQFNPQETNARIWGGLILSTKEGKGSAIAWLQYLDQPKELQRNLKKTEPPSPNNPDNPNQNPNAPTNLPPRFNQYLRLLEMGN